MHDASAQQRSWIKFANDVIKFAGDETVNTAFCWLCQSYLIVLSVIGI